MDQSVIAALEDEYRRDLEALARVRRIFASKNGSLSVDVQAKSPPITSEPLPLNPVEDLDDGPVTSLRGKIEQVINSDPAMRWTTQKMLAHLQRIGFPLKAKKPIYSVGQSLNVLTEQGHIRLIRKGVGSTPNLYRAKEKIKPEDDNGGFEESSPKITAD